MSGVALDARVVVRHRSHFVLDLAIAADAGEIVALMGPSAAGKSTLLHALAGLVALDDGEIRLGGEVVARPPRVHVEPARRGVVLLGQDPRLFPHLNAEDNVAFGLRARGVARDAARATAAEWLARVGLDGAGRRHPARLSGGQQQRVALARALAVEPRMLLLDEPLTSLDVETAADMRALLRAQVTVTTIVVSHDAGDAVGFARRLVILEGGRVVQSGLVADVLAAPATRFVAAVAAAHRFGEDPRPDTAFGAGGR